MYKELVFAGPVGCARFAPGLRGRPRAGRVRRLFVAVAMGPSLWPLGAGAQPARSRPEVCAVRFDTPPRIDGVLDDPVWQRGARLDRFVQQTPRDGEPATEPMEVWIGYDSRQLYFAFAVRYTDLALMRANLADRDAIGGDDTVAVYLDPFLDQQRAYKFAVNGYGIQADAILSAAASGPPWAQGDAEDDAWDALFESRGRPVADGWVAEMAIPFKSLRYPPRRGEHRWGFQIVRTIQGRDERDVWAPVSRDIQGFLTQMGVLCGLRDLATSRNLELLPTLTAVQAGAFDQASDRYVDEPIQPDVGLSVKYGVTSGLTLDVALNPDFSQIEADRPRITLNQRFPVFFEEKRPFFLEGQEIFDTRVNLLHTRTIVDPRIGVKVSGKVGRTTLGAIVANDEAPGGGADPDDPTFRRAATALVGRVRYDLYAESFLGAIVTERRLGQAVNRAAGLDGQFRLGDTHRLRWMSVLTQHQEERARSTRGAALDVEFRRTGRHLRYGVEHRRLSPGFQTDLGFIRRTDIAETTADVAYRFWPQGVVISWGPSVDYLRNYDWNGVLQDESVEAGLHVQFARNIAFRVERERAMERFRDVPFTKVTQQLGADINYSRRFSVDAELEWGDGVRYSGQPFLGRSLEGSIEFSWRPFYRLQTDLLFEVSRLRDPTSGEAVVDQRIARARGSYQLSDRWFLRAIVERDTGVGHLGVNLLVTYRVNAGTVVFVGYDDRLARLSSSVAGDGRDGRVSRAVFLKISYLLRL